MRTSIARKVTLSLDALVIAAVVGMLATYFVSTTATRAVRDAQQLSESLLAVSADLETDVVSAGLRVFQYLETRDTNYLDIYQKHAGRLKQHVERMQTAETFGRWREFAGTLAAQYQEFDRVSRTVVINQSRLDAAVLEAFEFVPSLSTDLTMLFTTAQTGSLTQNLGLQIETARLGIIASLLETAQRDQSGSNVTYRIAETLLLLDKYAREPLSETQKKLVANFVPVLIKFNAAVDKMLYHAQVKSDDMAQMLRLQQQFIATVDDQIKPTLRAHIDDAERRVSVLTRNVLIIAGVLSLLLSALAFLASRYLRRAIVNPIQTLAAGTDAIAAGKLDHRVKIDTGDEYSELAKNFNHMVEQLQGTMVSRAAHEEQASQLRTLLDSVHDYAIFSMDNHGFVTKWNTASERIFGYAESDMEGVSFSRLLADAEQARALREGSLKDVVATGRYETNASVLRKDGTAFEGNIVITPLKVDDGHAQAYTVVVRDITEKLKAERHIEQLATTDPLTGLSNRNMLMQQLTAAIARASRTHTQLAVMFIDLDHFKTVNDTLGHDAGDELLRECAQRLTECVRQGDVVARLGGDEFLVLLTDITDSSLVTPVADRMLKLLTTPYRIRGQEAQTSASIGICFFPGDGQDVSTLMKNADIAMYHAKEKNRNNYQFYAEEMNLRMLHRAQLERELHAALERQEFILHYQPQVAVATGQMLSAEALIRWQHPTRGLLPPGEFIGVAEETGLIVSMGEWVIDHVCGTLKEWQARGLNIPYISVNVSAAQLNEGLVATVRQALVKHGIPPNRLMLEVTETMLMARVDDAIAILRRIRELGIRIAMDDFGTGYSSLAVLQRLPLDVLKIDRSFVKAVDDESDNTRAFTIIGAIIAIAKELNLSVVAEGVETPTQLAFLRTLNCDAYQGYLYSRPIDTLSLQARFIAPAKSVLEDENGRAITLTRKVELDVAADHGGQRALR